MIVIRIETSDELKGEVCAHTGEYPENAWRIWVDQAALGDEERVHLPKMPRAAKETYPTSAPLEREDESTRYVSTYLFAPERNAIITTEYVLPFHSDDPAEQQLIAAYLRDCGVQIDAMAAVEAARLAIREDARRQAEVYRKV